MIPLPPRASIEFGLCQATERFALELASPQPVAPAWSNLNWQLARAAAVFHGVSPLLAGILRWPGPAAWQDFLQEQRAQTRQRYRQVADGVDEINAAATALGLAVVGLKGTALHALGVYVPGERPMADIDLLVAPADTERAARMLGSLRYTQTSTVWKHRAFERGAPADPAALPFGEHHSHPLKIDLHDRITERLPCAESDITRLIFPFASYPGLNAYQSRNGLFLHLLLHAAGNMCSRSLRLMHLNDISRLAASTTTADWERLIETLESLQALWWALPPLALVNRYHPGLVPEPALRALRAGCQWPLRRLCERSTLSKMSYASLATPAFPGLAWCPSPREALHYIRKRSLPDAEQHNVRRMTAGERWSQADSWTGMSQTRRILRWIFVGPARLPSMYIVRTALENPLQL